MKKLVYLAIVLIGLSSCSKEIALMQSGDAEMVEKGYAVKRMDTLAKNQAPKKKTSYYQAPEGVDATLMYMFR